MQTKVQVHSYPKFGLINTYLVKTTLLTVDPGMHDAFKTLRVPRI